MGISADETYQAFVTIMNSCFSIMKTNIILMGVKFSLFDIFLWSIVMYALLKLFFSLFE